jgi:hypothetical protein
MNLSVRYIFVQLLPQYEIFLQEFIITRQIEKFSALMEPEHLLLRSQELANELSKLNAIHIHTRYFLMPFLILYTYLRLVLRHRQHIRVCSSS